MCFCNKKYRAAKKGKLKNKPFYDCIRHSQEYSQGHKQKQIGVQKKCDYEIKCNTDKITRNVDFLCEL